MTQVLLPLPCTQGRGQGVRGRIQSTIRNPKPAIKTAPHPDPLPWVQGRGDRNQNSNRLPLSRLSFSPSPRRSSASSFAMNVTLKRTYGPASSHGTVLISFSVIIHWLNDSA